jgi:uridine phosphorylase
MAVMVSSDADLQMLSRRFRTRSSVAARLFNSTIYRADTTPDAACLVGPMIGAPYAVMVLERLIARGVNTVLFFGWCGSLSPKVEIGDIIIPSGAMIDEGTSTHYHPDASGVAKPVGKISGHLKRVLSGRTASFHEGCIWTTDAVYRETRQKVLSYQRRSVLAVEMEMSALFTVARYRNIQIGGILVVSDDLSTLTWQPGFTTNPFQASRKSVCEVIEEICTTRHHLPFGKE